MDPVVLDLPTTAWEHLPREEPGGRRQTDERRESFFSGTFGSMSEWPMVPRGGVNLFPPFAPQPQNSSDSMIRRFWGTNYAVWYNGRWIWALKYEQQQDQSPLITPFCTNLIKHVHNVSINKGVGLPFIDPRLQLKQKWMQSCCRHMT